MLIFGHSGITLGAAVLLNGVLTRSYALRTPNNKMIERLEPHTEMSPPQNVPSSGRASWLTSLTSRFDARLLLIGSLLPDIVDKPVGQFFLRDSLSNGRIFCHTLLFLLFITLAGFCLYRSYRKTWLLALSFGTFTHLIFDQMWLKPPTLLWPLFGFAFEKIDLTHWMPNILYALHTDPAVYVSELVGAAILIWFVLVLVRRGKFYTFIKNGQV